MMSDKGKVVLAYSGGLDTSVAVLWLQEQGYEVITFTADVGQSIDLEAVKNKALNVGATKAYVMDLREEFLNDFIWPSLKANALYQGTYPLNSAYSRPLIAKKLAMIAKKEGAVAVAHGCTGKGQDQVRIEVCTNALDANLKVLAPVRDWHFTREAEMEYAIEHGVPVKATADSPYSIDENMWGRSIECGMLENPWNEPPADAFTLTVDACEAPDEEEYVEIGFEKGVPVSLNGEKIDGVLLVKKLNEIGGKHGVGRIDMIEDRLVGFKSREVYECPAATILISAHKALETLTLPKQLRNVKVDLEKQYAELTYVGYWFSPLKEAIDAFVETTQEHVTGVVKVKLYKGSAVVAGMKSAKSIYDLGLATYSEGDAFDHNAAVGFIKIWGLPIKNWRQKHPQEDDLKLPGLEIPCQ
jgi:argininosuccinate synthase